MLYREDHALCWQYNGEKLRIEPWGENALRVRCTHHAAFTQNDWALTEPVPDTDPLIAIGEKSATIQNGNLTAQITLAGKITFKRDGRPLLTEYVRTRAYAVEYTSALKLDGREFRGLAGGDFQLTVRFESADEKLFGMGQYQQEILDLKGTTLELAHRNSQASIPFVVSSLGYGFLWNNPAIGEVGFSKNMTAWKARSTKEMDYWITAGDTPDQIVRQYMAVTGKPPMMPEYALGFWQCKLRYQTQEELLSVAREYKKRGLPLSVIVIDYYHWPHHGDWNFDFDYWPDPEAMTRELHEMGIKLMVSIWPTVQPESVNFAEMKEKGLLIFTERGAPVAMLSRGDNLFFDATNPASRAFIWQTAKRNYFDKGVDLFWLDEAEPEYTVYDYENYRYHLGPNLQVGNLYPAMFSKAFYDGMRAAGVTDVVNLVRCAWAGSQRYGALVWSGDVDSSFRALREQLVAGLHMGMAGIPWWTTDIGGFQGGDSRTPEFRECLVRWFEFGAFCPVFRLHGMRKPLKAPLSGVRGGMQPSGIENEVWSYGAEAEGIMTRYLWVREAIREYLRGLMKEAHETGRPVMRAMFYMYPEDARAWTVQDAYMLGADLLVAPVMEADVREREVYLPKGETWIEVKSGKTIEGGRTVLCDAPIGEIPLFVRRSAAELGNRIRGAME